MYELIPDSKLVRKNEVLCRVADSTGIVRACLPLHYSCVKEGAVVAILSAEADVDKDTRITVRLAEKGSCEGVKMEIRNLNTTNDMSKQEWVEGSDEESEDEAGGLSMVSAPQPPPKQEPKKPKQVAESEESDGSWDLEADKKGKGVVEDF